MMFSRLSLAVRAGALLLGIAATWLLAPALGAQCVPVAGRIEGVVFRDADADGVRDDTLANPDPSLRTREGGVAGVTVNVYDTANALVASTRSAADGSYALNGLTDGAAYRLEFVESLAPLHAAPAGASSASFVQFRTAPACGASAALHNPARYCQADPFLSVPSYVIGEAVTGSFNTTPVLFGTPYSYGVTAATIVGRGDDATLGTEWRDANGDNVADPVATQALSSQIGTTYGLAWRRPASAGASGTIYAAAFFKQFAGFGPGGPGAIYQIPTDPATGLPSGAPSVLVNVIAAYGMNVCVNDPVDGDQDLHSTNPANGDLALAGTPNGTPVHGDLRFNNVGKCAFGDLEISEDGSTLYAVNLFTRQVLAIDIATQALVAGSPWNVPTAGLPNSAGTCDVGDVRPFALGVWDDTLYVGGVCSAESSTAGGTTSGNRALLHAYVWRVNTATGAFTRVLDYQLRPDRADWWPWTGWTVASTNDPSANFVQFPMPMLADIEFYNGDLTLGFRDRLGDGWGYRIWDPADGKLEWASARGDLKCVSFSPGADPLDPADDVFTKEEGGDFARCGTRLADNGIVTGINLGGGDDNFGNGASSELYWGDGGDDEPPAAYQSTGQTPFPIVPPTPRHEEAVFGSLVQVGVRVLVTTQTVSSAPYGYRTTHSGYLHWINNQTGYPVRAFNLNWRPSSAPVPDPGAFGKANGLGDLEALCLPPPLEVGNRLWCDLDLDGVQDAGEGVAGAGITVNLVCDTGGDGFGVGVDLNVATTTDAAGSYLFNTATPGLGAGVPPQTACRVLVNAAQAALGAACGAAPQASPADVVSGAGAAQQANSDQRDSDGVAIGAQIGVQFTTAAAGRNDHSFDFGFRGAGTIEVTKVVSGGAAPTDWTFTLSVAPPTCDISAATNPRTTPGNGGATIFSSLPVTDGIGNNCTYAVAETPKAGYTLDTAASDPMTGITLATATVPPLWGIHESGSFLFRFTDYTQICAGAVASGFANLGILRWDNAGVPTLLGNRVHAFTIDTDGVAYLARSQIVGGFAQPVLLRLDLNTLANPPVATVVGTIPLPGFNEALGDRIAGLAIQPGTRDLYALYDVLDASNPAGNDRLLRLNKATGAVLNDLGTMLGLTERVAEGTDLAFAEDGTLYVTDADDDNLYVVDPQLGLGTANITAVPDNGQGVGYPGGNPSFNALAWDWDNNRLLYGNISSGGEIGEQTLPPAAKPGNNTFCTPLSNIVSDPESLAFLPVATAAGINPEVTVVNRKGVAIGDRVWLDTDGDGVEDIGEPGLANVRVTLHDAVGVQLAAANTDQNGTYLFDDWPPATYQVRVDETTLPAAAGALALAPGSVNPFAGIVMAAGAVRLDVDFGYRPRTGRAVIGDLVWSDHDGDGLQDPGEAGIGGVTLDLLDAATSAVLATTTTDAGGNYLFADLFAGEYRVRVTDTGAVLTGYSPTAGPQSVGAALSPPVSVLPDGVATEVDFGYRNPVLVTLTDRVWLDLDADGVHDLPAEPGIAGVTVFLRNGAGDTVATTFSDAAGNFSFRGLRDGPYTIVISDAANVLDNHSATTAPAQARSLAVVIAGVSQSAISFGWNVPGLIGDRVWLDADGDGVQDAGEMGITGVTVELRDLGGTVTRATRTTTAGGAYLFMNVSPGGYTVVITDSGGVLAGLPQTGDPDATLDGRGTVTLLPGQSNLVMDFGYRDLTPVPIAGSVWEDPDEDGVEEAGEPPLPGVIIDLLDAAGAVVATTTTDPLGDYLFPSVLDGSYTVKVRENQAPLDGYSLTSGLDAISVTVAGAPIVDIDFGYARNAVTGQIGDYVWHDFNRDGVQNGGENGLPNVRLRLYRDTDGNGVLSGGDTLVATTLSQGGGDYAFPGLPAGNYLVDPDEGSLPAGFVATPGTGAVGPLIVLSAGEVFDRADFGYAPAAGSAIGDQIFYDADADGYPDPGEAGLAGVEVTVTGPGGYNQTRITSADGFYLVGGVVISGVYTVTVNTATLPAGLDPVPTLFPSASQGFPVTAGTDLLYADFGFRAPLPGSFGSIGDTVFLDTNSNGVRDGGEPGLAGVTLSLETALGVLVSTTTTDSGGLYDFVGVAAGNYRVRVTDTGGVLLGLNLSAGTNPTGVIVLAAGQDYNDADFGYAPSAGTGTIGNLVWHDQNGDGDRDPIEDGVEGVSVQLWLDTNTNGVVEPGTDNLVRTGWTDPFGEYFFYSVPYGSYLVTVNDKNNVLAGLTRTLGAAGQDNNSQVDPLAVTLTAATATNLRADFGWTTSASPFTLSGVVFFDNDADGLREPPLEQGVANALLVLFRDLDSDGILDPSDPVFGRTSAGAGGAYSFANLPDLSDWLVTADVVGTYLEGGVQTTQLATPHPGIEPVSFNGANETGHDFGFTKPPTLALITTFGATVRHAQVEVEWHTGSEVGTLGFVLYRQDRSGGWVLVTESLVASPPEAPRGAGYRVVDPGAHPGAPAAYLLLELEVGGGWRRHGPFVATATVPSDGRSFDRAAVAVHPPSAFETRRLHRLAAAPKAGAEPSSGPALALRLAVVAEGIHTTSGADLAAELGLPLADVEQRLQTGGFDLRRLGAQVDWWSDDGGLSFFAAEPAEQYGKAAVYVLAPVPGRVAALADAGAPPPAPGGSEPAPLRFERNLFAATAALREPLPDFWFWAALSASSPNYARTSSSFVLPELVAGEAQLVIDLLGATAAPAAIDHQLLISVNGTALGADAWNGGGPHRVTRVVPDGVLDEGTNLLELELALPPQVTASVVYLDGFEVTYQRRLRAQGEQLAVRASAHRTITIDGFAAAPHHTLDITDPLRPRRLVRTTVDQDGSFRVSLNGAAGRRYLAAAPGAVHAPARTRIEEPAFDLAAPATGFDYLVIAPEAWLPAVERLLAHRAGEGHRPAAIGLQSIYDAFAHSQPTPLALREFLRFASTNWALPPRHVLLVGKGTYDYHGHTGAGANPLPPLLVATPNGLFASDASLGDLAGADGVPEIAIGRLPVLDLLELEQVIDKLTTWDPDSALPRVVLLADDPDEAGAFDRDSDTIAHRVPAGTETVKLYAGELGVTATRAGLAQSLAAGAQWVNYLGHGGLDRLAAEGLLLAAEVPALAVAEPLPLWSAFTCAVGRFEVPGATSLAEALVLAPQGGAIAVIAPSGLSIGDSARELNRLFAEALLDRDVPTLGEALRISLRRYSALPGAAPLAPIYHLLGDPGQALGPRGDSALLFGDDFESGGLASWSAATP